jgi:small conductance mechanosensitive channel
MAMLPLVHKSFACLLVLPLLGPTAMAAPLQEGDEQAQEAAEEVEQLLQGVQETADGIAEAVDQLKSATGEDKVILRNRFDDLLDRQLADLGRLQAIQAEREAAGEDATPIGLQVEQELKRLSRRVRSYITGFEADLGREAAGREQVDAEGVELFEHTMAMRTARLDGLYRHLLTLTEELERAELPADEETAFLQERLGQRGASLVELLDFTRKQLEQFRDMRDKAPENTQVQSQLFATEERYEANRTSLLATIHMMDKLGMDYRDLEVRALEITGEVTPEALDVGVAAGLLQQRLRKARDYLVDNGPNLLVHALVAVGTLVVFWVLSRLARAISRRLLRRTKVGASALLEHTAAAWIGRLVFLLGLIVVLAQVGIDLGPVLAGLGIAGFIVGFALQDTLANFAAGGMILAYGPYDVGDWIQAAGVLGQVKDMNLVSTRILTPDHQTLIVPNRKIWGDVILNITAQPTRRVDLTFGIAYGADIGHAERVLQEIVSSHEKVLADPEPTIKVHALSESSVDFIVRPWVRTEDYWNVHWDLTRGVKERFDAEGISIPFPQRDVHLYATGQDASQA